MHKLSSPNVADCRDGLSGNEVAADYLVPGNLSDQPGQDGAVGLGAEAATGRELPHGVADPPQADAGHCCPVK